MKRLALLAAGAAGVVWVAWDSVAAWWTERTDESFDPHYFDTLPRDEFWRHVDRKGRLRR